MKGSSRYRVRSAVFGGASVLTASTLVGGLGVGLVAHGFAGTAATRGDCAERVTATNSLLKRTVFAALPADNVRRLDPKDIADLAVSDCAWSESPGGLEALWSGTTGRETVHLLQGRGWSRSDPASGVPEWYLRNEPAGPGADPQAEISAANGEAIVMTKDAAGRRFGIAVDRQGMSAWVE